MRQLIFRIFFLAPSSGVTTWRVFGIIFISVEIRPERGQIRLKIVRNGYGAHGDHRVFEIGI